MRETTSPPLWADSLQEQATTIIADSWLFVVLPLHMIPNKVYSMSDIYLCVEHFYQTDQLTFLYYTLNKPW
ncbi:MAG: hypothetical protein EB161_08210 [Nitrosopumilaceae archaeon]|nr:hypothetical protein [Nitrososphaeria archaeon]NDB52110.1 hypothetical protein [Nitrosopumilaceae archaeon]NDB90863.1 hypothetical protein [Nitrososphaerota archaeon]NDF27474.1 hypothetical protein [Nitrosopumilaceae archaeon]